MINRRGLFKGLAAFLGCAAAAPFAKLLAPKPLPLLAASSEAFKDYISTSPMADWMVVDALTVKLSNLGPLAEGKIKELMGLEATNG